MFDFEPGHEDCGCCGYHASQALLTYLSQLRLTRTIEDWSGVKRVLREETADAPYVDAEVDLTALLAEHADHLADEVEPGILQALSGNYLNHGAIMSAMTAAAIIWEGKQWPTTKEAKLGQTLSGAALTGQHELPFSPALSDTERLRIVNGMSTAAKYYTNNYFNTQVMPALVDAVDHAINNGNSHGSEALDAIRAMLDRRLRSVPYWNIVANAAASRAYHYGYIKTGVAMGKRTIQYVATLDDRTSDICRTLNGMEWQATDVNMLAERIASAGPEEIKTITPWLKASDVAGKDAAELYQLGVVIPPVHARCRSRLIWL